MPNGVLSKHEWPLAVKLQHLSKGRRRLWSGSNKDAVHDGGRDDKQLAALPYALTCALHAATASAMQACRLGIIFCNNGTGSDQQQSLLVASQLHRTFRYCAWIESNSISHGARIHWVRSVQGRHLR